MYKLKFRILYVLTHILPWVICSGHDSSCLVTWSANIWPLQSLSFATIALLAHALKDSKNHIELLDNVVSATIWPDDPTQFSVRDTHVLPWL
jgi:hypothetical protein